jgi:3-oxoacyl-[acyl-carrier protein] reductase
MATGKRVALVTGASRGIGRAIAERLARDGAAVAVNYVADQQAAETLVEDLRAYGGSAIAVKADVTDPDQAAVLVHEVSTRLGSPTVLVNNVGKFSLSAVADTSIQRWRRVMDSNLNSVFYVTKAALPEMRRAGYGRIVNIGLAPTHLVRGAPNIAGYAIAKTGIAVLTRTLAVEEAPYGITVNCISPGLIDNGHLLADQAEWMRKRVPCGRLGRAEEIGHAVAFVVSDEASYISGANIAVSGAWDWEDRMTGHDTEVVELFEDRTADV